MIGLESFKDNKDLKFNKLDSIEYIFVSDKKMDLSLEEIIKNNLVLQTNPSVGRMFFDKFIKDNNLSYDKYMEVVSHRLLVEFVKCGFGIGFVVKEYVLDDLTNGILYEVNINKEIPNRSIGYLVRDNFIPNYAVMEFIKIIKQKY